MARPVGSPSLSHPRLSRKSTSFTWDVFEENPSLPGWLWLPEIAHLLLWLFFPSEKGVCSQNSLLLESLLIRVVSRGVSSSSEATALTYVAVSLHWSSPVQLKKDHQRASLPDQPNATIIYVK